MSTNFISQKEAFEKLEITTVAGDENIVKPILTANHFLTKSWLNNIISDYYNESKIDNYSDNDFIIDNDVCKPMYKYTFTIRGFETQPTVMIVNNQQNYFYLTNGTHLNVGVVQIDGGEIIGGIEDIDKIEDDEFGDINTDADAGIINNTNSVTNIDETFNNIEYTVQITRDETILSKPYIITITTYFEILHEGDILFSFNDDYAGTPVIKDKYIKLNDDKTTWVTEKFYNHSISATLKSQFGNVTPPVTDDVVNLTIDYSTSQSLKYNTFTVSVKKSNGTDLNISKEFNSSPVTLIVPKNTKIYLTFGLQDGVGEIRVGKKEGVEQDSFIIDPYDEGVELQSNEYGIIHVTTSDITIDNIYIT